ncbi:MAG: Copper resistance protein CopC [Acidimicrobiales bacterium]|nr:Copper resistance protein CopC [Acidimicrobiales bacterium]
MIELSRARVRRPTRNGTRRRFHVALATLVVVLVVLVPAGTASAHAELESSNPADGSVLKAAPSSVSLQFSESVSVRSDGVRVVDATSRRVDRSKAEGSGNRVTVPLGKLATGSYLVSWRVISADGHPVRGAFTFSVGRQTTLGSGLAEQAFAGSADRHFEIAAGVFRVLAYVGGLAAAGLVLMGALLRRPDEPTPVGRLAGIAAGLGLAGVVLQIPIQASLATGTGLKAITESGVVGLALADGVGWAALVTAIGLVGILVAGGLPFEGAPRWVALVGAAIAPLGFALTGHTRTMSPAFVGYVADLAHLAAGAAWLGGLLALAIVIRARRAAGDDAGAAEAVAQFSGWAALVLGSVIVAGTAMGWIEVGSLHALTSTTYGKVLLVKVGVVALIAAAAAWNRFRLVPAVSPAAGIEGEEQPVEVPARAWSSLVRIVRFEAIGIVAVLALTGALVNITPARTAVGSGPVAVSAPLGSGSVQVDIDPARVGRNDIHAYILDRLGRPTSRYTTATFSLSLPAEDLGPLDRTPVLAGPNHFQLVGTPLSPGGTWTLTITVKPDRFTEQKATVSFRVR